MSTHGKHGTAPCWRPGRGTVSGGLRRRPRLVGRTPRWARWLVYIALIVAALLLPAPAIGGFMSP